MNRLGKRFAITERNAREAICSMGGWIRKMAYGHGVILGLSGGVDSAVVARLVQEAGVDLKVLMLPDGEAGMDSNSFRDAVKLAELFRVNYEVIDIAPACNAMRLPQGHKSLTVAMPHDRYLAEINIAPRIRAGMLYQVGQLEKRRVIGTDNLDEQVTGYFTKFGDGAYDFNPLTFCTKAEVYLLARALGVIDEIVNKPPSAELSSGQTDEDELGIKYADLDTWIIDGTCGNAEIDQKIQRRYESTGHKRCMPYAFNEDFSSLA